MHRSPCGKLHHTRTEMQKYNWKYLNAESHQVRQNFRMSSALMSRQQARQYPIAMIKEQHIKNDKATRNRWIHRFLSGHPVCQEFLKKEQRKLQELETGLADSAVPLTIETPDRFRIHAPIFAPTDSLHLLKNPMLFTLVTTWFGLPFSLSYSSEFGRLDLRYTRNDQ